MCAIALVIGIDDYARSPLTSAVNDAIAFRDVLLELDLVAPYDITLLTAPARDGAAEASRASINEAMKEIHDKGSRADRLYFYFAGHGLSAYVDAAHAVTETMMVPPDVGDLDADSGLLINFDDFRHRLESAGPGEQFFFFDACRDLVFEQRPVNPPRISWAASPAPSQGPTAQGTLYAVAQGGKAVGVPDGMGAMTQHLVGATRGDGVALEWYEDLDAYVVTAESIARAVTGGVFELLPDGGQWTHQIMLPELRATGPPLTPLRVVEQPPTPALTLAFEPEEAAKETKVTLSQRGGVLETPRWPPCRHGEAVELEPQVYRLRAESWIGTATVDPPKIDLRLVTTATIRVIPGVLGGGPDVVAPERGATVEASPGRMFRGTAGKLDARVVAEANEPAADVEMVGTEPPYRRFAAARRLVEEHVPPGTYAVRFRLGNEVYSELEIDVGAGDRQRVIAGGAPSEVLAEAGETKPNGSVLVSETIGPMRASGLLTTLPLLGVLPFDLTGSILSHHRNLVSADDPSGYGDAPVRVLLAAEGGGWPDAPRSIATDVRCEVDSGSLGREELQLRPLTNEQSGWGRVVHGTVAAPGGQFVVRLRSPHLGVIELAAAALPGRITVIGLVATSDGRLDVVQHLLRVPGRAYQEPEPDIPYARFVRELILGQRLYESGTLLRRDRGAPRPPPLRDMQTLRDLLYAKWTDPIVGCMAYYAWHDAVPDALAPGSVSHSVANNLRTYFGALPDVRVIAALAGLPGAPALRSGLAAGELPVLAQSLRALAGEDGMDEARRLVGHVAPGSAWTLVSRADATAAAVM